MLTLFDRLLIATVGRQMPSSTCFLIEILNLEKISGYLLQNVLKFATSLSYKKPCLTNLHVSYVHAGHTSTCTHTGIGVLFAILQYVYDQKMTLLRCSMYM